MTSDRAVFLDRDGTINRNLFYSDSGEFEGPRAVGELRLYSWTISAMASLRSAGYSLFIVSNQPNFAKGKTTLDSIHAIHGKLIAELGRENVEVVESYYCLHHPTSKIAEYSTCNCRKPSPRFLLDAAVKYNLDLSRSWMIGDRPTDIECGKRAGVQTIRLKPDHPLIHPQEDLIKADHYAADLLAATRIIINGK